MYELATLKTKKLSELQEIAKKIGIKRIAGLKKLDLVYQIVDFIASKPDEETNSKTIQAKQNNKSVNQKSEDTKHEGHKPENQKKTSQQNHIAQKSRPNNNSDNKSENRNLHKKEAHSNNKFKKTGNQNNNPNQKNSINNGNRGDHNHNKDNRSRYRQPDFEFDGIVQTEGVLDMMTEGYGFLRSSDYNYLSSPDDVYVSQSQIRLFGLKTGDTVLGSVRPPKEGEKYFPLIKVDKINGLDPKVVRDRVSFQHLTPLFPQEKFNLADKQSTISSRIMARTRWPARQPCDPRARPDLVWPHCTDRDPATCWVTIRCSGSRMLFCRA